MAKVDLPRRRGGGRALLVPLPVALHVRALQRKSSDQLVFLFARNRKRASDFLPSSYGPSWADCAKATTIGGLGKTRAVLFEEHSDDLFSVWGEWVRLPCGASARERTAAAGSSDQMHELSFPFHWPIVWRRNFSARFYPRGIVTA